MTTLSGGYYTASGVGSPAYIVWGGSFWYV